MLSVDCGERTQHGICVYSHQVRVSALRNVWPSCEGRLPRPARPGVLLHIGSSICEEVLKLVRLRSARPHSLRRINASCPGRRWCISREGSAMSRTTPPSSDDGGVLSLSSGTGGGFRFGTSLQAGQSARPSSESTRTRHERGTISRAHSWRHSDTKERIVFSVKLQAELWNAHCQQRSNIIEQK